MVFWMVAMSIMATAVGISLILSAYIAQFIKYPLKALRYDAMGFSVQRVWRIGCGAVLLGILLSLCVWIAN